MSHLLQGLGVGLLSHICDQPSVSVPEFCVYLPVSIVTFHPLYLEWEDSSAGPTLICVVVVIVVVMYVCWLYMCVGAEVVYISISLVVLDLWPLLLVGKGLLVLLAC